MPNRVAWAKTKNGLIYDVPDYVRIGNQRPTGASITTMAVKVLREDPRNGHIVEYKSILEASRNNNTGKDPLKDAIVTGKELNGYYFYWG